MRDSHALRNTGRAVCIVGVGFDIVRFEAGNAAAAQHGPAGML